MKILLISPTEKGIGGVAQHVQGFSQFLTNKNHKVSIISSENTFTIPIKGLKNPSFMLSSFLKSRSVKGNDIVHAHNIPSALAMKKAEGKKVLSLHGIYSQQITELHGKTYSTVSKNYEEKALNWADSITAVSKETCEYYSKFGFNVRHIPNAVDLNNFPKNPMKKFENLIVGIGPSEEKIRNVVNSKTNVHYLGYQSKEDTISLIRGSDLLVQPSIMEGISSTLLEAMGCGTCIIASNVGGNAEILDNDKTGILIEPNNAEKLLDKISDLLTKKEKRLAMAAEGLKTVTKYDWKQVGKLYLDTYESLLH